VDLHVSLAGRGDRTTRIYRQLREAILDGRLRAGDRLPPTRELASRLEVARGTVAVAYERLTAEGFAVARVGAGTFVSSSVAGEPVARTRTAPGGAVRPRPCWEGLTLAERDGPPARYDFRIGTPDRDLFPFATWRRMLAEQVRASGYPRSGAVDAAGHAGLRAAIARYVGVARSVRATADDVLVTQGAQQALDLIGRVLIEPGDCVAVEEPGYPQARLLFGCLGARVVTVPVDRDGIDVTALPAAARLVYVTPSHQFPLGTPMSLARRAALLEWAAGRGAVIVEDDYDSEFRFSDRPLEPLQSLDRAGRVVYVGTFSKTLLPMLRLGFLVAPASLQPALRTAKELADRHGDHAVQAALARFIDSGELARHVRKASRIYAVRHAQVGAALAGELSAWLDPVPSVAGLHVAARLRPSTDVRIDDVRERARALDVEVDSLAAYGTGDRPRAGLVLGYGAIPTEAIPAGLHLLTRAFHDAAALTPAAPAQPASRRVDP
jgi:GntR family transcriptional regulator/MocR family aminotransferase